MRFRRNLPNTLTLLNVVAGFSAIVAVLEERVFMAAGLILFGVVLDVLDGKLARIFAHETELGKQLDSLADMVTFGVAPAVFVIVIAQSFVAYVAGAMYVFSAALRLGRFNVQKAKKAFFGVPTTVNGILLPLLVFATIDNRFFPWYLFVMAVLMNAPIRIPKLFR